MRARKVVSQELSHLFGALANQHRIRIVEELRSGELDVNSLQQALGISHSSVSQHLAVLRSHRLVQERREGRHVFYSLSHPQLAAWILEGLDFLAMEFDLGEKMRSAVEEVRNLWSGKEKQEARR
jgi:DNA-binding transcriptional ArsR family regulator